VTAGATKVAVIGAGWWGREHARAYAEHRYADLVAVVARTRGRAASRTQRCGSRPYTDITEMLDAERPDLVSVCLPSTAHFEPTLRLLEAGVPLVVENPLTFDLEEADRLRVAAADRSLFFAIVFNHRFARTVELARDALDSGRVGEIKVVSWRFGGEGSTEHHPYANLIETQCHAIDLLELLCGPIEAVAAEMTDPATSLVLALRFASGAVGSLVGTYDASYAHRRSQTLEIVGRGGRVTIDDTVARFSYQPSGDETEQVWQAGYFNDGDRRFTGTFDRYVDATLRAFRAGEAPPVPATAGRRALAVGLAAIKSSETGRRVRIAP